MIRTARLSAIEALLQQHGVLSTQELASRLEVSAVTVRRDLDAMADAGRIERVFGGAALPADLRETEAIAPADQPFHEVLALNAGPKRTVAELAASRIADGDTVFLDIGTTVYTLAGLLADRTLTVVTGSMAVVELLAEAPGIELIILGGEFNREYRCTQGVAVEDGLRRLPIDRAILGCSGVSESGIVRDTDAVQARIKQAAIRAARESWLLADSSKFPGVGGHFAADLSGLDLLVLDRPLDPCSDHLTDHRPSEVLIP